MENSTTDNPSLNAASVNGPSHKDEAPTEQPLASMARDVEDRLDAAIRDVEDQYDIEEGGESSSHELRSSLYSATSAASADYGGQDVGVESSKPFSKMQSVASIDMGDLMSGDSKDESIDPSEKHDSFMPLPDMKSKSNWSSSEMLAMGASHASISSRSIIGKNFRVAVTQSIDADGKESGFRVQSAQIRDPSDRLPHCRRRRGMKTMKKLASPMWAQALGYEDKKGRPIAENPAQSSRSSYTQYRITSMDTNTEGGKGQYNFGGFAAGIYDNEEAPESTRASWTSLLKPNQLVVSYLFWAFRSSFMAVLLSAAVWFTSLTFLFALCIYLIGSLRPNCIHVNGIDFGQSGVFTDLMDAYALSWTTFSTVGYGLVYPATSATTEDVRKCFGITIFSTLEAFVGILFASFWGAIFLSKVTRVSSFAQVTFSDPIVCTFGAGLQAVQDEEEEEQNSEDDDKKLIQQPAPNFKRSKLPCPVLEFRVLNRLENQKHGEILDATMNIVASIDEAQLRSSDNMKNKKKKKKRKKKAGRSGAGRGVKDYMDDDEGVEADAAEQSQKKLRHLLMTKSMSFKRRKSQKFDEDPTGSLVSRKIFAKLEIESQEHPFFKRIWNARHVLDQDSPLLKQDAKDLILLNGGHWPTELNSAESVRASMHFDQILVSLSGTSNADCNSVYAQKVYDYVDLCIGYRFCNVMYRNARGVLTVDPDLLNDVTEQEGGGGEDLQLRQAESTSDIFIL